MNISRRDFVAASAATTAAIGLNACSSSASNETDNPAVASSDTANSSTTATEDSDSRLSEARQEIDTINTELVPLLERRLDAVSKVMEYKIDHNMDVLDSSREAAVLEAVGAKVQNPDYKDAVVDVFQAIMDITKQYEERHM